MTDALWLLLGAGAFFAGFVDAVVGGGGLIQIPLLFSSLPQHAPATLFGTNKIASIVGTASAAVQYARRVTLDWRVILPGAAAALIGAWFGAKSVAYLNPSLVRPVVLVLLIAVALYTYLRPYFGTDAGDALPVRTTQGRIIIIGLAIGYYDGFFGPGTGSFFIFLLIRALHMDFLHASASAKILNFSTNLAAISFFAGSGAILWKVGLLMAACNLAGAITGSSMALKHGTRFVRRFFLLVVSALIARMAWDMFA
ncbi:MAG: sulfite exporter TauE/SafE family protein [Proteobacteria bacterium]|nr:MAG: sulfite exporter TauE/SafE family protein [Pseudomonadota bacterium]